MKFLYSSYMNISELFYTIEHTSGISDKLSILKEHMSQTIKDIYSDCYDNDRKYGVHKFDVNGIGVKTLDDCYPEVHELLNKLCNRELTGNQAVESVERLIAEFKEPDQKIIRSILDKKLTIGLSMTSFWKLVDHHEKKFEVALACHLEHVKNVNPVDGTWYASRKLDGCRVVAKIVKNGSDVNVSFLSRQGKPIETLSNVIPALKWFVRNEVDGTYYADGEGCILDSNGDEDFQSILREIKRKDHTIENPCYNMFDFLTESEFLGETESAVFEQRYQHMLDNADGNQFDTLKVLHQEVLHSQDDFDRWEQYVKDGDWEGFMLRKNEPFKTGRLKTLLKVKKFEDEEYVVKDVEIATMTTVEPGVGNVKFTGVKSLIIEHMGCPVNVGSGLTKQQRIDWYEDPKKIIGKTVTVKYFEQTQDQTGKYSLRFPVLKAVYEEGRTV